MPILFVCPHCQTKSQVADNYAGQSGPCAACGRTVTIPYPGSASSAGGGGGAVTIMIVLGLVFGLMLLCLVGGGAMFFVGMRGAVGSAQRMQSQNNLRQIGLALHNYHDANGAFPPAYVTDENGKPLYSWRVLILPYVEEDMLYRQFNLKEPWDSPTNLPLSQRIPRVFQSPNQPGMGGMTDYAAFVGPEAIFDPKQVTKLQHVSDGTSNTILVTEIKGSTINWAEPRDIEFSKSSFTVNAAANDIGSSNSAGCNVLMGDGSTRFLPTSTPPGTIRSMATKAGNEVINFPN